MIEFDTVDGYLCRPGTADHIGVEDTRRVFRRAGAPELGDVCLDLGGHVGSFTGRALKAGATRVRAVEPDPANCDMFRLNVDDYRVELVQAAIGPVSGEMDLFLGKTHGHSTSLAVKGSRPAIVVRAVTLEEMCDGLDPTFLKIDIEGGEYYLDLPDGIPRSVDRVFMEFHLTFGQRAQGEALRRAFHQAGWIPMWETPWNRGYVEGVFTR